LPKTDLSKAGKKRAMVVERLAQDKSKPVTYAIASCV
jgi:hypothetical protein